ncbi:uncharacterized protein LOC124870209 isoform X2 [Girardinichthys multiradiatus]|uniref:uncharacterized protein LOC124870209 isoform X2 n=1 Tax=Girardinichthys multiradiatus TaxID=208333 RepID=UPI001FACCD32|nr:uncharacterized protein LOC124870209 isoform X2 [Girardinichthys multiradiatus]
MTWKKHQEEPVAEVTRRHRMAWVAAVGRRDITFDRILPSKRVCSLHFHSGKPAYEMLESHPDWKPSLLLGHSQVRQEEEQQVTPHTVEVVLKYEEDEEEEEKQEETGLPQPVEDNMLDQCALEQITCLKGEFTEIKLTELFLQGEKKVKYYTGLQSHSTFQVLLRYIKPFLPQGVTKLTHFQMVLLTLMSLKLNFPMDRISHLFNVHPETAIAAFEDTVAALYARMSSLVHWPDRERVWVSMPRLFVETFGGQLTVVVDCFEVSAKTLSNIESWDQHSRTVKYVTGITPQGVISFISRGRSGCSSDIEVTESCGLLDKLLLGDIVLAGRGFNVEESVSMMCAEVKASSPDGCRELDLKTTEETRQLAHLRDHVKRIIGAVCNTFKILSSNVPVRMVEPCEGESVTFLDKVVTVCCALINLCPHGVLSLQKSK